MHFLKNYNRGKAFVDKFLRKIKEDRNFLKETANLSGQSLFLLTESIANHCMQRTFFSFHGKVPMFLGLVFAVHRTPKT